VKMWRARRAHRQADAKAGHLLPLAAGCHWLAAAIIPESPQHKNAAPYIHKGLQGVTQNSSTAGTVRLMQRLQTLT
jgi:hypothetical protein